MKTKSEEVEELKAKISRMVKQLHSDLLLLDELCESTIHEYVHEDLCELVDYVDNDFSEVM